MCHFLLVELAGPYWAGWHDEAEEGEFMDVHFNKLTSNKFQPWFVGEPNGETLENCVTVWVNRNAWNDDNCDYQFCAFCEFERAPHLQLRGNFASVQ